MGRFCSFFMLLTMEAWQPQADEGKGFTSSWRQCGALVRLVCTRWLPFFNKLQSMNHINLSTESQFYGLVCLIVTQLK